jgi:prevent-host-death family protein
MTIFSRGIPGQIWPTWLNHSFEGQKSFHDDPMQVNILEAKNRLSLLIKAARSGEDVVIANRGEPVARLVPVRAPAAATEKPGSPRAILDWLKSHPLPAYAKRSAEEIDAAIRVERSSWD